MQTGTKLVFRQPDPDGATKLKDNETIIVLSQTVFNGLVKDKAFELSGMKFAAVTDTTSYILNNKPADVLHATTANGKNEIWVLNNPDFPLIYRGKSNAGSGI